MSVIGKITSAFSTHGWRAPEFILCAIWRRFSAWRTQRAISGAGEAHDLRSAFSLIYEKRWWDTDGGESASGPGSTLAFTQPFRAEFERFLRDRQVKVLFDAPCGDWNWMKEVSFPSDLRYIGGDIVPQIVERLRVNYGDEKRSFAAIDITSDELPSADVWLCRDCLAHLSYADIEKALANFSRSKIPYALISNYVQRGENTDIASGGFRDLDLTRAPFCLPEPDFRINDWPDDNTIRQVCLWSREQIAAALAAKTTV